MRSKLTHRPEIINDVLVTFAFQAARVMMHGIVFGNTSRARPLRFLAVWQIFAMAVRCHACFVRDERA